MKFRSIEKKIYKLLGINIFRKYVLFTWEKLCKLIGLDPGYRINSKTIEDIEEYKSQAKAFGYAHFILLFIFSGLYFFHWIPEASMIVNLILNSYCIMTQRYTCIRINEILEKYKKLEKRKLENEKNNGSEENFDFELNSANQKVEKQEQMPTSIETYYSEKSFETLKKEDSNFADSFTRVLKKHN